MRQFLFLVMVSVFAGTAFAGPVTPDGESYEAPGELYGFRWHAGVSVANLEAVTVPYDGQPEWNVSEPAACQMACLAFRDCQAFLFIEPQLKLEGPRCRMLSEASEFVVQSGYNLYLPQE